MRGWEIASVAEEESLRVCVVMPTYNEAQNITRVLDLIYEQAAVRTHRISVLIVDDNSPDGTADIVREYRLRNPNVHLLLRTQKEGLGKAYIAGMQYAMATLGPDVIFEMDADLSHNPADIFRMLEEVGKGADCVIGSRYVDGGSIPDDWGIHRKITSSCANLATRMLLGIDGIRDCSGGFRAIRTSVLSRIDLENLHVRGYAFQAVLLEEIVHHGGKVREIPIAFADREAGSSKMRMKDMLEGFTALGRVRMRRMFGIGSASTAAPQALEAR